MAQFTTEYFTEIEKETNRYLARIRQIDKNLEGPVKTLIRLAKEGEEQGKKIESSAKQLVYFPTWISDRVEAEKKDYLLTQSVCCATLQRLWRLRHRFSWLDKEKSYVQLGNVQEALVDSFTPENPSDFDQCVKLLYSETLGGLNPLSASQVFRVLMEAGEKYAHSGMGFLAFFAGVWPLCRSFPDSLTIGARIEPWEVTAYVTAKCVLNIKILQKVINMRASLFRRIAKNLTTLQTLTDEDSPRKLWEFNIQLDDLGANLSHLSSFSIHRKALAKSSEWVEETRETLASSGNKVIYENVLKDVGTALILVRDKSGEVLGEAERMVKSIRKRILKNLEISWNRDGTSGKAEIAVARKQLTDTPLGLRFSEEYWDADAYWEDLATAAKDALGYCDSALGALNAACDICPEIKKGEHYRVENEDSKESISKALDAIEIESLRQSIRKALDGIEIESLRKSIDTALLELARANTEVGNVLDEPVKDAARWCRSVVDREIAHVSAENLTDFDPSELVSAIAVAVAWNLLTTPLQVSDAVTKAIAGARKDGSWRSGKPFYVQNHAFGIWAVTSDIVWTLTSAIEQFPAVREADEELFNYVDWLERTQITIPRLRTTLSEPSQQLGEPYFGWASERLRDRRKIHLGTTALSINALLEIRDLAEYRLWQLCKKRFSVFSIDKPLKEVDPVDLGAGHSKRLHRRLALMARKAQQHDKDAEYSLVLHGPPGSSKTKVAEALSAEMWKSLSRWGPSEPRLIRITPADFTRLGEDRLDSEARVIFDLISGVRAVTIFFDEIDDLLRQRNISKDPPRFMDLVVPAMLNRLADLRSACPSQEICFLLATNYVENIDPALIRKGRIDDSIPVVYPDFESRKAIIGSRIPTVEKSRAPSPLGDAERQKIATKTAGWPYTAITSACDVIARELSNVESKKHIPLDKFLDSTIADQESSFSKPAYNTRRRYSQELLNEYLHHIISCSEKEGGCKSRLSNQIDPRMAERVKKLFPEVDQPNTSENASRQPVAAQQLVLEELYKMLDSILEKEGRDEMREVQLDPDGTRLC